MFQCLTNYSFSFVCLINYLSFSLFWFAGFFVLFVLSWFGLIWTSFHCFALLWLYFLQVSLIQIHFNSLASMWIINWLSLVHMSHCYFLMLVFTLINLIGTKTTYLNTDEAWVSILTSWCCQFKKIAWCFHILKHGAAFLFFLNFCVHFH